MVVCRGAGLLYEGLSEIFLKKVDKTFGGFRKILYLCAVNERGGQEELIAREFSPCSVP